MINTSSNWHTLHIEKAVGVCRFEKFKFCASVTPQSKGMKVNTGQGAVVKTLRLAMGILEASWMSIQIKRSCEVVEE
jgi:hypothetical protein